MLTTYSIPSESMYKIVIHVTQDVQKNWVISPITQEFHFLRPMSRISADIKLIPYPIKVSITFCLLHV